MGNFQRDNRSGYSGRSFDRDRAQGGGRSFQRPGLDRPQMFRATCANCGNECEVPFRPTGSKPIFCNNCFDRNAGQGGDAPRRSFSGRDSRVRTSFNDRPMYDAICTNCGNSCKIPFEPKEGREILCSDCFEAKTGSAPRQSSRMGDRPPRHEGSSSNNAQIEALNAKLDKIMAHLGITNAPVPTVKLKEVKREDTAPVITTVKKEAKDAKVLDAEEPKEQEESVSDIIEEVLAEGIGETAILPESEEVVVKKKAAPKKKSTKKKE